MKGNNNYDVNDNRIPDSVIDEFVYTLLPEISRFYQSEDNRKAFEEWKNGNAEAAKVS
jgi:hypothetical protein